MNSLRKKIKSKLPGFRGHYLQSQLKTLKETEAYWHEHALMALQDGRDDLAREAVAYKLDAARKAQAIELRLNHKTRRLRRKVVALAFGTVKLSARLGKHSFLMLNNNLPRMFAMLKRHTAKVKVVGKPRLKEFRHQLNALRARNSTWLKKVRRNATQMGTSQSWMKLDELAHFNRDFASQQKRR